MKLTPWQKKIEAEVLALKGELEENTRLTKSLIVLMEKAHWVHNIGKGIKRLFGFGSKALIAIGNYGLGLVAIAAIVFAVEHSPTMTAFWETFRKAISGNV